MEQYFCEARSVVRAGWSTWRIIYSGGVRVRSRGTFSGRRCRCSASRRTWSRTWYTALTRTTDNFRRAPLETTCYSSGCALCVRHDTPARVTPNIATPRSTSSLPPPCTIQKVCNIQPRMTVIVTLMLMLQLAYCSCNWLDCFARRNTHVHNVPQCSAPSNTNATAFANKKLPRENLHRYCAHPVPSKFARFLLYRRKRDFYHIIRTSSPNCWSHTLFAKNPFIFL